MNRNVINELRQILTDNNVYENENMAGHTTFKVGGPADIFITPRNSDELINAIRILNNYSVSFYIIGNGSNLLVSDKGYRGAVIQLFKNYEYTKIQGTKITASSGILMSKLARYALDNSLTGLEFAAGIPGTFGGGITMNAGAYGGELRQVVKTVTLLNLNSLEIEKKDASEMAFSYRNSIVKSHPYVVLESVVELELGNKDEIMARMEELKMKRVEKQPLNYPSAGSTFKRPEGYFAGKLIEDAGLKGYRVGDAMVSMKHSGFVINEGNATASDIYRLIGDVQRIVYDKFGVKLEREVLLLGEFE